MSAISKIKEKIKKAKTIAVVCHVNPDGDCIGSLLALALGLESMGKRVYRISPDGVPVRYKHLPGVNKVRKNIKNIVDMAISVDCNAKDMIGQSFENLKKAKDFLEIDHHQYRNSFGNLFLIDHKAAAVGEQIYFLLNAMNVKITSHMAENILTSIIVETNSFRLPQVRSFTFKVCSAIMKTGIDYTRISELMYWSQPKETFLVNSIALSRTVLLNNGKIAWSIITKKDFKKCHAQKENADSIANDILSIDTVVLSVFFREKENDLLRVSLRSKKGINVGMLAREYGGGGHADCAGCSIKNSKKSINEFLERSKKLLVKKR